LVCLAQAARQIGDYAARDFRLRVERVVEDGFAQPQQPDRAERDNGGRSWPGVEDGKLAHHASDAHVHAAVGTDHLHLAVLDHRDLPGEAPAFRPGKNPGRARRACLHMTEPPGSVSYCNTDAAGRAVARICPGDACGADVRPIRETGEAIGGETGTPQGDLGNPRPSGRGVVKNSQSSTAPASIMTAPTGQVTSSSTPAIPASTRSAVPANSSTRRSSATRSMVSATA
jgi:hypothetical protein